MSYLLTVALYALIIVAFYTLVFVGVSSLPAGSPLPDGFVSGVQLFFSYVRGLDFIFPMGAFFTVLGIVLTFNLLMFGIRATFWVIHLVRGSKK